MFNLEGYSEHQVSQDIRRIFKIIFVLFADVATIKIDINLS